MPGRSGPTRYTYAGLFLVALATLTHQILLTRIFSVTMWYHFAFVAISIAMFGMTAGALLVYLLPRVFTVERTRGHLAAFALAFAVFLVLSFLTQLSIPFLVHPSVVAAYAIAFTIVVISVPFVLSGVCVSLVLTRFSERVSGLYAADLAGAAAGCLAVVGLLQITDAATSVIAVGALAGLASLAFALDAGHRRLVIAAAAVTVVLAGAAVAHTALVWRQFPVFRILYIKGALEARPVYEKWNSYSRVRVTGTETRLRPPTGWGLSPALPADRQVRQLQMDIDVSAGTVMTAYSGRPEEIDHLKFDVTNVGYYLRPGPSVAIIGAGGGRDVLSALAFGASRITAIEINDDILDTVNGRFGGFTGHLDRDPRVRFVNDEARSFLARQADRVDLLQISLIDTWAATAAGAFVMSENALYTREAWRVFLSRLTDTGILSVSRWYASDRPGEVYRLVALASTALADAGITEPRRHMLLVRNVREAREDGQPESVGTLLVSRTPFTGPDVERVRQVSRDLRFEIMIDGERTPDATLEALTDGRDATAYADTFPIDISPPSDDSPFFFQMLRLRDLADVGLLRAGKNSYNMQAVFVLGVLMLTVIALGAACVFLPAWLTRARVRVRSSRAFLVYFAAIGLGFMLIEISQMQRLNIVLGHPTYGLTVVLFALLLSSGVASFLTRTVSPERAPEVGPVRLAWLVAVLLAFGFVTPLAVGYFEASTTGVRAAAAGTLLFVPGLLLGQAFPIGMKLAHGREELTPWLWGINGALSVCGSVLAVVLALTWSISTAFWVGCACYAVALLAVIRLRRAAVHS
jgi:hypothetical protein